MARVRLTTEDAIAAFLSNGGAVTRLDSSASTGITKRDWDNLVRGTRDGEPVECEALIEAYTAKKPLKLRAGYGAIA